MDRNEIGLNAGKVWQLLSNNEKWGYGTLKRTFEEKIRAER